MSESLTYGSVGGPVGQPPALPGTASPPCCGSFWIRRDTFRWRQV